MSAVVLAICGDAGGANAVAPVIELLRAERRVEVRALAYAQACTLWRERGLAHEALGQRTSPAEIGRLLAAPVHCLLTGTSVNGLDYEKLFIAAARAAAIPSLSVLDFWANYAQRFRDGAGALNYLPDRIAVMDEQALTEMQADGIEAGRIVVTGHPAWDNIEAVRAAFTSAQRRSLRASLALGDDDWLVLYASQPIPQADGGYPWYDREVAVEQLIEALEAAARRCNKRALLLIRSHPREGPRPIPHRQSDSIRIESQSGGDGRPWLLAADTVVGMATMLLVESVLLGRPTLSLRLGLDGVDPFPPARAGRVPAVYRREQVAAALEAALLATQARIPPPIPAPNASRNVADLIYRWLDRVDH